MKRAPRSRGAKAAVVALGAAGLLAPAAAAVAAFTGSTSTAPATFSSAASYGETKTWSPYIVGDRSAGAGGEIELDDPLRLDEGSNWYESESGLPLNYDESRYLDIDYGAMLPAGLAVTNPEFEMHFASRLGYTTSLYVKLYRKSTMTLLATSAEYDVDPTGTTIVGTDNVTPGYPPFDISAVVTTTDIANDLLVRIIAKNDQPSGPNDALYIDMARLTGSTTYGAFDLNRVSITDTISGATVSRPWPLVAVDGTELVSSSNWQATFASTRYMRYEFPYRVPAGSSATSVTLHHAYRPSSGTEICYYVAVYDGGGGPAIATHGSAASPYCYSAATPVSGAVRQDDISLPELTGSDAVNGFEVRFYWSGAGIKSHTDLLSVETTYVAP